jgi:hypothetical protein
VLTPHNLKRNPFLVLMFNSHSMIIVFFKLQRIVNKRPARQASSKFFPIALRLANFPIF